MCFISVCMDQVDGNSPRSTVENIMKQLQGPIDGVIIARFHLTSSEEARKVYLIGISKT